jgi:hypothetical protein
LKDNEIRVSKLEDLLQKGGAGKNMEEIRQLFAATEKDTSKRTEETEDQKRTACFGGLSSIKDIEEAKKWMTDKLWDEWLPQPENMYPNKDFKGILYAKFRNSSERDSVIAWFKKSSTQISGSTVWSKPDKPLHERVMRTLLFGTKFILDKSVWVDPDQRLVTLWGEKVLQASIVDEKLSIVYGDGWEEYLHHKDHPEFVKMVKSLHDKLAGGGKGDGKKGGKFGGEFQGKGAEQ